MDAQYRRVSRYDDAAASLQSSLPEGGLVLRAAADDDHIKTFDLEHGREGVAAVRVGLVLVVGGEAGAHDLLMVLPEMRLREMRLVGRRRLFVDTAVFFASAAAFALEDNTNSPLPAPVCS